MHRKICAFSSVLLCLLVPLCKVPYVSITMGTYESLVFYEPTVWGPLSIECTYGNDGIITISLLTPGYNLVFIISLVTDIFSCCLQKSLLSG